MIWGTMNSFLKADLHVHTCYSHDSTASLQSIVTRCIETGIQCLAVTDHNVIEGAFVLKGDAPLHVIIGEEVKSTEGDIIGLFLKEGIPKDLSPQQTVREIKSQGGLVMVPHPFDRVRPSALGIETFKSIVHEVDIVETFNARNLFRADDDQADEEARTHRLVRAAASDGHTSGELGRTYNLMPAFMDTPQDFLQGLSQAQLVTKRTRVLHRMAPTIAKARKFLSRSR